jgi:hypothetical protein
LEDLDTEADINSAWETTRENIKISIKESLGYYELRKHEPWFDKGCSELLDQKKQPKLQWLQDPSKINLAVRLSSRQCQIPEVISGIKRTNI